jgi:hypothetical protein
MSATRFISEGAAALAYAFGGVGIVTPPDYHPISRRPPTSTERAPEDDRSERQLVAAR